MKKLSEVCKIVGITRRTLQEYDRINLVKPSAKTEAGYWLYDDAAIEKLILIRLYLEAGYKRTDIKRILESPMKDVTSTFDAMIEMLEERRRRIDGMIGTVRTMQMLANMPDSALKFMNNINMAQMYREKSFSTSLEEMINGMAECEESEREEVRLWSYFWYNLCAIGHSKGTPADSETVQNLVHEFYQWQEEVLPHKEKEVLSDGTEVYLTEEDKIETFCEVIFEMLEEQELREPLEKQCGAGGVKQILKAVEVFGKFCLTEKQ